MRDESELEGRKHPQQTAVKLPSLFSLIQVSLFHVPRRTKGQKKCEAVSCPVEQNSDCVEKSSSGETMPKGMIVSLSLTRK